MKKVQTTLNKEEHKQLREICKDRGISVYGYIKRCVVKEIENDMRQKQNMEEWGPQRRLREE